MSKSKTVTLALKIGHTTSWRQTVAVGDDKVQLVFEPGVDKDVTQAEIDGGLQPFIDCGLLVDPNRDPKGRQRRPPAQSVDADKAIEKLERKIEKLSAENAQLKADLEAATKPG